VRCRRVRGLVELYAGGDLPPRLQRRVQKHLQGCDECSAELGRLQRTLALGRKLFAKDRVFSSVAPLWPEVRVRLLLERRPVRSVRSRLRLAVAGVALAATVVAAALLVRDLAIRAGRDYSAPERVAVAAQGTSLPVVEGGAEPGTTFVILRVDEPPMSIIWFLD